jgi:autotransporter-associated beta strand protein
MSTYYSWDNRSNNGTNNWNWYANNNWTRVVNGVTSNSNVPPSGSDVVLANTLLDVNFIKPVNIANNNSSTIVGNLTIGKTGDLNSSKITIAATGTEHLIFNAGKTFSVKGMSGTVPTVNCIIDLLGNLTIDIETGCILYINSDVTGGSTSTLTISGSGKIIFAKPISFTGKIVVSGNAEIQNNLAVISTSIPNILQGNGFLTTSGTSKTILTGNSTFTGTLNITSGCVLQIGDGIINSTVLNPSLISNIGELIYKIPVTTTISSNISGGGILKISTGTTIISNGILGHSGPTNIESTGILQIGDATHTGAVINTPLINSGTFKISGPGQTPLGCIISGPGQFMVNGTGTTIITANNIYTGATTIASGTLQIGDGISPGSISQSSSITNNGNLSFKQSNDIIFNQIIDGTGNVSIDSTGKVIFTEANTYNGTTTIVSGTLQLGNGGTTGSILLTSSIINNGTLSLSQSGDLIFNQIISGSGGLTIEGTGKVTLATTNEYNGQTKILSGTLQLGNGTSNGNISSSSSVLNNSLLIFKHSSNITFDREISGTGGVTIDGTGNVTFTGTNQYSGETKILSGTLQLGNGGTSGSILQTSLIINNSNLSFNQSSDITFDQIITGSGNISIDGTGMVTFTVANTYTGSTTISGGTLQLGNGGSIELSSPILNNKILSISKPGDTTFGQIISGSGNFSIDGNGTVIITGENTYTGSTLINSGKLQIGNGGITGNISSTSSIVNNSNITFNKSSDLTLSKSIIGSGDLIKDGSGKLIIANNIFHTGQTNINSGILQLGDGVTDGIFVNTSEIINNSELILNQTEETIIPTKISGTGKLVINSIGKTIFTANNTYTGDTEINSTLQIGNSGTSGNILSSVINNSELIFNRSNLIEFGALISGPGSVIISGSGKIILTAENTYTGTTTINSGQLQIGGCGPNGSINMTAEIINDSVFIFSRSDDVVFDRIISGTGKVMLICHGKIILTGENTYSGNTEITNGTLQIGNDGTTGSINATSNIINDSSFVINKSVNTNIANLISGTGEFVIDGNGKVIITNDNVYTGTTKINNGELQIGDGVTIGNILSSSNIINNSKLTFNNMNSPFSGLISGTGDLIIDSIGKITLTNANTYTGETVINSGELELGDGTTDGNINSSIQVLNFSKLSFNNINDIYFDPIISETGDVELNGTGKVIFRKNNTYTGTTTINNGSLQLGDNETSGNIGSSSAIINNSNLIFNMSSVVTINSIISGDGDVIIDGTGKVILTNNNTYSGTTTINSGNLQIGNGGTDGSISSDEIINNSTLIFNKSDEIIFDGIISGTGDVIIMGSGTVVLTNSNTYTGETIINDGELQIGNGGTVGSISPDSDITNNSSLTINRSDDYTFPNDVYGYGSLTSEGSGQITYTGETPTIVSNIDIIGDYVLNAPEGDILILNNISGEGSFTMTGSGKVIIKQNLDFNGPINLGDATLEFGCLEDLTIPNQILGDTLVLKSGTSKLTLLGDNSTFTGKLDITTGELSIGDGFLTTPNIGATEINIDGKLTYNVPNQVFVLPSIVTGSGILDIEYFSTVVFENEISYSGNIICDGTLVFNYQFIDDVIFANNIQGIGYIKQIGINKVILSGQSVSFTGVLRIESSTIQLGYVNSAEYINPYAIVVIGTLIYFIGKDIESEFLKKIGGHGTVVIDGNGSAIIDSNFSLSAKLNIKKNSSVNINSDSIVAFAIDISGNGTINKLNTNELIIDGDYSQYSGVINVYDGILQIKAIRDTTNSANINNSSILKYDTGTFIINQLGVISGTGELYVGGDGKLIIASDSTYSGNTIIESGILQIGSTNSAGSINNTNEILNGGLLVTDGSGNITFNQIISGNGGLQLNGSGIIILTAENTYSGLTTISNGILQIGDDDTYGSIKNNNLILNNATLSINSPIDAAITQKISGTGDVIISGLGKVTLSNLNNYDGTTIINSTLVVENTKLNLIYLSNIIINGQLIVNTTNTIECENTISGSGVINILGTGELKIIKQNNFEGTIIITENTTLNFEAITADIVFKANITGSGELIKSGSSILILSGGSNFTGPTVITDGTLQIGDESDTFNSFNLGDIINTGILSYKIPEGNQYILSNDISGNGEMRITGNGEVVVSKNYSFNTNTYIDNGTLTIGNGETLGFIAISEIVNNSKLAFNRSDDIIFENLISGTGEVIVNGQGKVTFINENTYNGATKILSGSLQIGNGGTVGSISETSGIIDNTLLIFDKSSNLVVNEVISGPGEVRIIGYGKVIFTAENTYTGNTVIENGELQIGDNQTLGSISSSSDIINNGSFTVNRSDNVIIENNITGPGTVADVGDGTVVFQSGGRILDINVDEEFILNIPTDTTITLSNVTGSGTLIFSGSGKVIIDQNIDFTGKIIIGDVVLEFNSNGNLIFPNIIEGNAGIIKSGEGSVLLTGDNTYLGSTTISDGELHITNGSIPDGSEIINNSTLIITPTSDIIIPQVISGTGNVELDGSAKATFTGQNSYVGNTTIISGTFELSDGGSIQNTSAIINNATFSIAYSSDIVFGQVISGSGDLSIGGTGKITLTGENTYGGDTIIESGKLEILDGNVIPSSSSIINNSELIFDTQTSMTISNQISGQGDVFISGEGKIVFNAVNTYGGTTNIQSGILELGEAGSILNSAIVNNGTLNIKTLGETIINEPISGTGDLVIDGPDKIILANTNNYSGTTTIESGELVIAGSISNSSNIINNSILTIASQNDLSFSNEISGTGNLVIDSNSTITFNTENTYEGSTTILSGTLKLADGGSILNSSQIINNSELSIAYSADTTFSQVISGSGNLEISGIGTITLGAANTYTGTTTISSGELKLNDESIMNLNGIINNSTLIIEATNDIIYDKVISGSGNVMIIGPEKVVLDGTNSYTGTTTIASGTLEINNSSSILSSSEIINNSSFVINTPTELTIAQSISGSGSVEIIGTGKVIMEENNNYTGSTTISSGILELANNGSISSSVEIINNSLLTVSTEYAEFANIISGTGDLHINTDGKVILFAENTYSGNTIITTGTLELNGYGSIQNSTEIQNNGNITLSPSNDLIFTQTITGTGDLTIKTSEKVTLENDNLFSGDIIVSEGNLQIVDGCLMPNISGIINNATVSIGYSEDTTFTKPISGTGNVVINGNGITTLTGENTYSGNTIINSGILEISNDVLTNSPEIINNTTLIIQSDTDITIDQIISGSGNVIIRGPGKITFTGTNTYTGTTTIESGTLELTDGGSISGSSEIINNSNFNLTYSQNTIFDQKIVGTGNVTIDSNAKITLTSENTYQGTTTISSGILELSGNGNITNSPIINNGVLLFSNNVDTTFSQEISGTGHVIIDSSAKITLEADNSYTGDTIIDAGTLTITGDIGESLSIMNNGVIIFAPENDINVNQIISGNGDVVIDTAASVTFTGENTYDGTTTITSGNFALKNGGTINNSSNIVNNGTFIISESNNQIITGTGGVIIESNGQVTLTGANTYSGPTTVNSGTLLIENIASINNSSEIINNAKVVIACPSDINVSQNISGTGDLEISTNAKVTISGETTYSGSTTIQSGTLNINNILGLQNSPEIINNATFDVTAISDMSICSVISGSGNVFISGSPGVTVGFNSANTYTGSTTIETVILSLDGSGSIANTSEIINNGKFMVSTTENTTISQVISGSGDFIIDVDGTVTLTKPTTYSGETLILRGTLKLLNEGALENSIGVINYGTFEIDQSGEITLNIPINGSGDLTLSGDAKIIITEENHITGTINIQSGELSIVGNGSIGTDAQVINNSVLSFDSNNTSTLDNGVAGTGNIFISNNSQLSLGGESTLTGQINIDSTSTLILNEGGSINEVSHVVNNGTFEANTSTSVNINQTISGSGDFIASGTGTVIITEPQTYTGNVIVNETATLELTGNGSFGSSSIIQNNGTLEITTTNDIGIPTVIGSGDIVINVPTETVVTLTNTTNENITVTSGILETVATLQNTVEIINNSTIVIIVSGENNTFQPSIGGTGQVSIEGNGSIEFTGNNTYTGSTNVGENTTLIINTPESIQNSSEIVNSGTVNYGGNENMTLPQAVTGSGNVVFNNTETITVTESFTHSGTTEIIQGTVELTNEASFENTSQIINNATLEINNTVNTSIDTPMQGSGSVIINVPDNITVSLDDTSTLSGNITIESGTVIINNSNAVSNVSEIINNSNIIVQVDTVFNQPISGTGDVTIQQDVNVVYNAPNTYTGSTTNLGNLTVNDTLTSNIENNGTLSLNPDVNTNYNQQISGSGNVNIDGDVSLSGPNNNTGSITILDGSLTVGNSNALGNTTEIINNAELILTSEDTVVNQNISGTGGITVDNNANVVIGGNNTYSGSTEIISGSMDVTSPTGLGQSSAISVDGSLIISNDIVISAPISGAGNIIVNEGTTVSLGGNNTYTGDIINNGTTNVVNGGSIENTNWIVNNGTLEVSTDTETTVGAIISGSGNVIVSGSGTVVLTGNNTYSGETVINNGSLQLGDGGTTGSVNNSSGIVNNGQIIVDHFDNQVIVPSVTGNGEVISNGSGQVTVGNEIIPGNELVITDEYTIHIPGNTTSEMPNNISGDGNLIVTGTGTLIITQIGEFTGKISSNGIIEFNNTNDMILNNTIDGDCIINKIGDNTLIITGDNTISGTININQGSVQIGNDNEDGIIDVPIQINGDSNLIFNKAINIFYSKLISGTGNVIQNGSGAVIFNTNHTYTGNTIVNAGILIINSTIQSTVVVNSSGKLKGTGSIGKIGSGPTIIRTGATLEVGNSPGHMTIIGDLIHESNSEFSWEISDNVTDIPPNYENRGVKYSVLTVTGNMDIDPDAIFTVKLTEDVDMTNDFWKSNRTWDVLDVKGQISENFKNSNKLDNILFSGSGSPYSDDLGLFTLLDPTTSDSDNLLTLKWVSSIGGGGDPLIKPLLGKPYMLPMGEKIFNLFKSSQGRQIIINAKCGFIHCDKINKSKNLMKSDSRSPFTKALLKYMGTYTYFRYISIILENEYIVIDMENLEMMDYTTDDDVNKFNLKKVDKFIEYKNINIGPITTDTKGLYIIQNNTYLTEGITYSRKIKIFAYDHTVELFLSYNHNSNNRNNVTINIIGNKSIYNYSGSLIEKSDNPEVERLI